MEREWARNQLLQMRDLSTAEVRTRLEALPQAELRELATYLGIWAKQSRVRLVEQMAPKAVNYTAYWRLGRTD